MQYLITAAALWGALCALLAWTSNMSADTIIGISTYLVGGGFFLFFTIMKWSGR